MKKISILLCFFIFIISCKKEEKLQKFTNNHWKSIWQNKFIDLESINFLDKDTGFIRAFNDSLFKQYLYVTYNGGDSWKILEISNNPSKELVQQILPVNGQKLFFHFKDSNGQTKIKKSEDGGLSWNLTNLNPYSVSGVVSLFNLHYSIFYIIDENNYLLEDTSGVNLTTDGGNTWSKVFNLNSYRPIIQIHFISNSIGFLYYTDNDNYLAKTKDGGKTWETLELKSILREISSFNFVTENIWYYEDNYKLFKTMDGGFSFQEINTIPYDDASVRDTQLKINFIDADNGYYCINNKLYITKDGGKTWALDYIVEKPTYATIKDWVFTKSGDAYLITNAGGIVKKVD